LLYEGPLHIAEEWQAYPHWVACHWKVASFFLKVCQQFLTKLGFEQSENLFLCIVYTH
jgi:hypothetical protein